MNKRATYWIWVIVIVVIIIIGWFMLSNNNNSNDSMIDSTDQTTNKVDTTNNTNPIETTNMAGATDNTDLAQNNNVANYLEAQNATMNKMMADMKSISATGDPALDFLYGMIPHHESAIAMSKSLLEYGGNNAEVKQIAENIISSQSKEVEEMKAMIKELEANMQTNQVKEEAYLKAYNKMMDDMMSHNMNTPSSVDEAFIEGMIGHHEMAIEMSKTILDYTDNEMIREMAQNIIDAQTQEITQMKELLKSMK